LLNEQEENFMPDFNPKNAKRCAYCKRFTGDAQLRRGNNNGTVWFKEGVKGKCTRQVRPMEAVSGGGSNCQDYAISVEADRFV